MNPDPRSVVTQALTRFSLDIAGLPSYMICKRPVIGGPFGFGAFVLASISSKNAGLDEVTYFVQHAETGFVIGAGLNSKADALASAREILKRIDLPTLHKAIYEFVQAKQIAVADAQRERAAAFMEKHLATKSNKPARNIPRRRRRIFDESNGKCHYCGTTLTLDGEWHVEHKMPKALGGDNSPTNLVAACIPCNQSKRDTTDVEFFERLKKESA